jgi:hypothetical protein
MAMDAPEEDFQAARVTLHDQISETIAGLSSKTEFVDEWVIVVSTTDEDGESSLARVGSPNLLSHHRDGLLHEGLYGFGGEG